MPPKYKIEEMTADEIYELFSKVIVRINNPLDNEKFHKIKSVSINRKIDEKSVDKDPNLK